MNNISITGIIKNIIEFKQNPSTIYFTLQSVNTDTEESITLKIRFNGDLANYINNNINLENSNIQNIVVINGNLKQLSWQDNFKQNRKTFYILGSNILFLNDLKINNNIQNNFNTIPSQNINNTTNSPQGATFKILPTKITSTSLNNIQNISTNNSTNNIENNTLTTNTAPKFMPKRKNVVENQPSTTVEVPPDNFNFYSTYDDIPF